MNQQTPGGKTSVLDSTTMLVDGKQLIVNRSDAQQIAAALKESVSKTEFRNKPEAPSDVEPVEFEGEGIVRLGLWLLQSRSGKLVALYRPVPQETPFGYQYVAQIERVNNQWRVNSVTLEHIRAPNR